MKKTLGMVLMLSLVALPVLAQKVHIDYSREFDFNAVKTFQYVETAETNDSDSLMADRIERLLRTNMAAGNLDEVMADGDILVTYHVITEENTRFNTTSYGYDGFYGGWGRYDAWGGDIYGGGMGGSSTTTQTNYTVGTLVIDAYDAAVKKMVWRGTGTVTVKSSPSKQVKQIEKIFAKMGKKWDKIHSETTNASR